MKRISVFGATGSIGQNTLDLIARAPERYDVVALTCGRNVAQLAADAIRLDAKIAVTSERSLLPELKDRLEGTGIAAEAGPDALLDAAARPADWVMSAIVGAAGLAPGMKALEQGATLALANKESLVCAGPLMMRTASHHGATILPVDSEHSAVFQALRGERIDAVDRVILTASGGALRDWPVEKLHEATVADASRHPNWDMGQKITIDSASMFNKAMEVIEAKEFFGLSADQVEVLIHPQSAVHALVGFRDGAYMAHLGEADMRHAIGFALHYPDREFLPVERLDLAALGRLDFSEPDPLRYPALEIASQVMQRGGHMGAIFNAAKEEALTAFINGEIRFTDMARLVARVLEQPDLSAEVNSGEMTLASVHAVDSATRRATRAILDQNSMV